MASVISIRDMDKDTIEGLLKRAGEHESGKAKSSVEGKVLATLFFEASTRTKLSFQSAALRNGMTYIDFLTETSSLKKGESFTDTIKTVSGYADALAIRHPMEGSARLASETVGKPVVNGGDGGNQHPTQTLIDLYTIKKTKGRISGLDVTLFGDLKHARTMRSLLYALAMFGAKVTLVSPKGLEMDPRYVEEVDAKFPIEVSVMNEPEYSQADVLYVCRIQKERFADPYEAQSVTQRFTIKKSDLKDAKEDLAILHPLPKINEIEESIDAMPQAKYFEQAHYGVPVRQAVLEHLLR